MAGQPTNMERGSQGGSVTLDVYFRRYNGGPLVDDDRYSSGVLPVVHIYNPNGVLVQDSSVSGVRQPDRSGIGEYSYRYDIPNDAEISDQWRIQWSIRIDGNDLDFSEYFRVVESGDAGFDESEYRVGYAFDNPNRVSDHHAPGWGLLVTPDELRYDVHFGTKLVSPDANQTYTDAHLQYYIDYAISMIERDLDIDILPRVVRHEDLVNPSSGERMTRTDVDIAAEYAQIGRLQIREPGYPYRAQSANHYLHIRLRRRPLREVTKAQILDPIQQTLVDIWPWRRVRPGYASTVQFFPSTSIIAAFPFISPNLLTINYPFADFPNAIVMDYETGFETADKVDMELRMVVLWTAGIILMENFGDGKAPGIASASASLNSISESYSTTQSATNALYGARIAYYKEHLKNWLRMNRDKYARNVFGIF